MNRTPVRYSHAMRLWRGEARIPRRKGEKIYCTLGPMQREETQILRGLDTMSSCVDCVEAKDYSEDFQLHAQSMRRSSSCSKEKQYAPEKEKGIISQSFGTKDQQSPVVERESSRRFVSHAPLVGYRHFVGSVSPINVDIRVLRSSWHSCRR